LAKIDIKNDAVIRFTKRSYTDFISAADRDGVYSNEATLIAGFEELSYNQVL